MKIKLTERQFKKLILKEQDFYECEDTWQPVCAKNTQNDDTIVFRNECHAIKAAFEPLYSFGDSEHHANQSSLVKEGDFCSADIGLEKSVAIDNFLENVIEELRELQTKMTKGKEDVCNFLDNVCYGLEGGGKELQKQKRPSVTCAMSESDINSGSIIRNGCFNDFVGEVQRMLVDLNYDIGDFGPKKDGVDDKYGKYTMNGIRKFQKENGLKSDGITEKNTYTKLKEIHSNEDI